MAVQPGYAYPPVGTFFGPSGTLGAPLGPLGTFFGPAGTLGSSYSAGSVYSGPDNFMGSLTPGPGAPDGAYIMRAYKTTIPTGHVYWISLDEPDLTGDRSGYPPGDLLDILVVRPPCVRDPRDLP